MIKNCNFCSKDFTTGNKNQKCCSRRCAHDYRHFNQTKAFNCETCGKEYRRSLSELKKSDGVSRFCSIKCVNYKGENNPNYNNSSTIPDKHRLRMWGLEVKKRDDYTCQDCGENNKHLLHSHHLKERRDFPELRFNLDNGITLCIGCHAERHKDDRILYNLILNTLKNAKDNYTQYT